MVVFTNTCVAVGQIFYFLRIQDHAGHLMLRASQPPLKKLPKHFRIPSFPDFQPSTSPGASSPKPPDVFRIPKFRNFIPALFENSEIRESLLIKCDVSEVRDFLPEEIPIYDLSNPYLGIKSRCIESLDFFPKDFKKS